jgi:hypothetical protein
MDFKQGMIQYLIIFCFQVHQAQKEQDPEMEVAPFPYEDEILGGGEGDEAAGGDAAAEGGAAGGDKAAEAPAA